VKRSKLWEIYTLISPFKFILPPTLLTYFIPFLNSHILHLRYSAKIATILPIKDIHWHTTSFRRSTKFTTVYGSSVIQLPYCIRFNIYTGTD